MGCAACRGNVDGLCCMGCVACRENDGGLAVVRRAAAKRGGASADEAN